MSAEAFELFHMPGSCSRVALVALEEIGGHYRDRSVDLLRGAQREQWFRAINPKGKVPVLIDVGTVYTELPTIAFHLARRHPEAGLMPAAGDGMPTLESLSDLIWLAGALQPLAGRLFRPAAVTPNDEAGVKALAAQQLAGHATMISTQMDTGWWKGDRWSIADSYIEWIFNIAGSVGFPLAEHPVLVEHGARTRDRAAFGRAVERERAAVARDDISPPPGWLQ